MADAVDTLHEEDLSETESVETQEWLESLDYVLQVGGPERVVRLLRDLEVHALRNGVEIPFAATTPYINTIPRSRQAAFPGDRELERRIKSLNRWNAMAMVVRANKRSDGIGGHISTYASAATLYEVAYNHFFRGPDADGGADMIYFQGHASPGIYARAFLEGRLTEDQLNNFRRELQPEGGLSSYPHPWLMPDFWQFPTVSMGLGPIMAIYQARFNKYLENRGLIDKSKAKVWCFIGDGETDEPETLGAISLGSRERLDNLIFVVNCNLQRLDGPVRGNGKIIQELEGIFRGARWNVIKVVWGADWDPLLEKDQTGMLVRRMGEVVDGEYQKYIVEDGAYIREKFFGKRPELLELVEDLTDEQLLRLRRGGHDPEKVYAAYKAAVEHEGSPTVILAKTIKGYGMGEAGEARNVAHQQKKMEEDHLRDFRDRFGIPIGDEEVKQIPFYRPPDDSPEMEYLKERRKALGGSVPQRKVELEPLEELPEAIIEEFYKGTDGRNVSTTMVLVRIIGKLLRDKKIGKLVVPIIPDEARTFGMDALFSQVGIYSPVGQLYEPVDAGGLMYYRESRDGQLLQEGITEAGAMSSFIAAGTAYATHGLNMIPVYIFYSMFGLQRVGDLIWAAADTRAKGFLIGATAGRTTLNGEGLQHEDGNSHLLAYPVPNLMAYDPAFAYELAVIVREGVRRMYAEHDDVFYYLTVENENYPHPPIPEGDRKKIKEGIIRGIYRFQKSSKKKAKLRVGLLGSGAIMTHVLKARSLLEEDFGVAADVWSVTSYKELHKDGLQTERWNRLHPAKKPRTAYLTKALESSNGGVFVAASDYVKALPESVSRWVPGRLVSLGTDGFGRSESRDALRDFFEVDYRHIALAALTGLAREGRLEFKEVEKARKRLKIDSEKPDPTLT
jgi:pyruvate dehydrogenase E1 component